MHQDLSDVVRAAQQGARPEADRAFAALLVRFERPVQSFLLNLVHHRQDAEDLAAETFFRVWKGLPGLRDPVRFPSFLFQTAHRLAIDLRRKRQMKSHATLYAPEILETFPMAAGDPYLPEMRKAIASLPPDSLSILNLKYEQGLTYQEIAEAEGVSVSTVRDRLVIGRERLEGVLQRGGFLEPYARMLEEKRRRREARGNGGSGIGPAGGESRGGTLPGAGPTRVAGDAIGPALPGGTDLSAPGGLADPRSPGATAPGTPEAPRG